MNAIWGFYDAIVGVFEVLGPAVIASLLVAVVSVRLTFWYHDRRDKRNALLAFQSEVELNDMETEMMIHDIFGHRDGFEDDSDTRNTVRLASSGYETLKNSGTLANMPQRARESIESYYTMLRLVNRTLDQRENISYNLQWQKRERTIQEVDKNLLTYICTICGPARLDMVADLINENEEVEERLQESADEEMNRELGGLPIFGDYDEVQFHISNEIESMRVLPFWGGIRERIPR